MLGRIAARLVQPLFGVFSSYAGLLPLKPQGSTRFSLAQSLFFSSMQFIFLHENVHVELGHLAYLARDEITDLMSEVRVQSLAARGRRSVLDLRAFFELLLVWNRWSLRLCACAKGVPY